MTTTHGIQDTFGAGGDGLCPDGQRINLRDLLRSLRGAYGAPVANDAAMIALDANSVANGQMRVDLSDGSTWRYVSAATATDTSGLLFRKPTHAPTLGGWCLMPGAVDIAMPVLAATADATALLTLPTGALFMPSEFWFEVTTGFTGGTSSAIGLSSGKTGFTTKGDLLGGAAGDVAATLVAGNPIMGTIGPKWDTLAEKRIVWKAGDTFRFDRVTSAFTAGIGKIHAVGQLVANPGL